MSLLKPVLPYIAGAAILVGGVWLIDYRAYNRGVEDEATRWQKKGPRGVCSPARGEPRGTSGSAGGDRAPASAEGDPRC